jgi:hypothetical protein
MNTGEHGFYTHGQINSHYVKHRKCRVRTFQTSYYDKGPIISLEKYVDVPNLPIQGPFRVDSL